MSHIHSEISHLYYGDIVYGTELIVNTSIGQKLNDYYYSNKLYASDFFEILFFKKGKGQLWINDRKIDLCDNCVVFLSPRQRHCYHLAIQPDSFRYLIFREESLNSFLVDKYITFKLHYYYQTTYPSILKLDENQINKFYETLSEMEYELTDDVSTDSAAIVNSLLYYTLMKLNHLFAQSYSIPESNGDNNIAFKFKELLEKAMTGKQTVSGYADILGVSRVTLNTAVKAQYGLTATELLKNKLIHNLKNDLVETNYSVAYLSDKYGFSEPNHLMRFFKSQTGQTIKAYLDEYTNMMSAIH